MDHIDDLEKGVPTTPVTQADTEPDTAQQGAFKRFFGVLFSPGETFKDINRKPTWIAPIIIALFISGGFWMFHTYVVKADWEVITQEMMKMRRVSDNQSSAQQIASSPKFVKTFTIAFYILVTPFLYLCIAGILSLALLLLQVRPSFKKVLSVVSWTYCSIALVTTLILSASIYARGFENIRTMPPQNFPSILVTNLGSLLPSDTSSVLRSLGGSLDLFSFWIMILLAIGLAAISGSKKVTTVRTGILVFSLWGIYVLIKVSAAAIFV